MSFLIAEFNMNFLTSLLFMFFLFVIFSYLLIALISFVKSIFSAFFEIAKSESEKVASAKTKYISGKKYAEEYLKTLGKEIGKGEKAKAQKKLLPPIKLSLSTFASMADNLLQGILKLLKK
ncbi:MAG: hypothetical protein QXZ13_01770 [Candidatus Diapherotrites archaeon]